MELCQFPPTKELLPHVFPSSLCSPGLWNLLLIAVKATVLELLQGAVVLEVVRVADFHRNMVLEGEYRLAYKRVTFSECTEVTVDSLQACQSDL